MRQAWPAALLMLLQQATIAEPAELGALYGSWDPGGRAFEGEGALEVTEKTVSWAGCRNIPYKILDDRQMEDYPHDWQHRKLPTDMTYRVIVLEIASNDCVNKNRMNIKHMRFIQFAIAPDYPKSAGVVFYDDWANDKWAGWGTYGNMK
jgi:hypothetical protein